MSYESRRDFSDKSCLVTKLCSDGKPCLYPFCSFVDAMGNVHVCRRHDKSRNGFHFSRRQVSPIPIFNKHLRLFKLCISLFSVYVRSVWGCFAVLAISSGRTVFD